MINIPVSSLKEEKNNINNSYIVIQQKFLNVLTWQLMEQYFTIEHLLPIIVADFFIIVLETLKK